MSDPGAARRVSLILLDVEGTTTPVRFVTDVLFPYARARLRLHLGTLGGTAGGEAIIDSLRAERSSTRRDGEAVPSWSDDSPAATLASALAFVEWLMDRDRKSTALKELQGRIWEIGYRRGELVGEVFPDVPPALRRWNRLGVQVGIFSSGSVLAQQLLFRHSSAGDLTRWIQRHFDTRVGAKSDPESYRRIARTAGTAAESVLFLSDVPRELDAAGVAGLGVVLVVRPGNAPVDDGHSYQVIHTLDEVMLM